MKLIRSGVENGIRDKFFCAIQGFLLIGSSDKERPSARGKKPKEERQSVMLNKSSLQATRPSPIPQIAEPQDKKWRLPDSGGFAGTKDSENQVYMLHGLPSLLSLPLPSRSESLL